jgi:hypothetical protein
MNIPVENNISEQEFIDKYIRQNQPVIIRCENFDQEFWKPDNFTAKLGDLSVQVYDALFDLQQVSTLKDYIEKEFNHPESDRTEVPYIRWYSKLKEVDYAWSDEAFALIADHWNKPPFFPSKNLLVPLAGAEGNVDPTRDRFPYRGILVAAKGARTRLHRDPFCSDAVVQMFHGVKEVSLYHPDRSEELTKIESDTSFGGFVDVRSDDPNRLSVKPDYHGFANSGDHIYIPHGWLHDVIVVEDSLSTTWNFIHESGAMEFIDYLVESPEDDSEFEVLKYFYQEAGHTFANSNQILKQFNQVFVEIEETYA